ncbi:hypothetical protein K432DRAFT_388256 [Lepidopterella palustris CBS 459.81]|uniref:F-box domain-containing protein n=1 Tax=Lepidopterella palustris CBS 459.81 TaxID=1314670 RepID=A0A8E2JKC5_9PEZI|nr:hypothetical protein K432DRAFT_388256 [Lepidopterella palustris CBS 459.81]
MPRTMSAVEYQELGKKYYKQKEYQKAVDAFTEGIESMSIPSVGMLNNRAASFEKLEDYKMAVKDGRDMIKIDKKDVRGYLRTGNILQKMEKSQVAIEIYKYGLKNVPVTDENFKLLQSMHDKLTRQLSPPKAIDPFAVLPIELVEMIISYLTFRNMVTCLRVSMQWKRFLISRVSLWTHLDLSHARRQVSVAFVRDCIRRSQFKIKTATIHRFTNSDVLRSLATTCKSLSTLDFLSGSIAGDSLCEVAMCATQLKRLTLAPHIEISLDAVTQVLRHRPTLSHAEFFSINSTGIRADWRVDLPNLQTLTLTASTSCSNPSSINLNLPSLYARAPNLAHLKLNSWQTSPHSGLLEEQDFTPLPSLTSLALTRFTLSTFPRLPPSLHTLILSSDNCVNFTTLSPLSARNDQNALDAHLPLLRDLEISCVAGIGAGLFEKLLLEDGNSGGVEEGERGGSKLMRLSLANADIPDAVTLFALLSNPRLAALSILDLTAGPVDDEAVAALITLFPNLTHLNLAKTRVTGVSVKALVKNLGKPGLKWLGVDYCMGITSEDAVRLARGRGVEPKTNTSKFKVIRSIISA